MSKYRPTGVVGLEIRHCRRATLEKEVFGKMSIDDYFKKIRDKMFSGFGFDKDSWFDWDGFPTISPDEFEIPEGGNNPNARHFSISYRYATGMDAPEVRTSGNLPEEEMKKMTEKFLERVQNDPFGGFHLGFGTPGELDLKPKILLPDGTQVQPGVGPLPEGEEPPTRGVKATEEPFTDEFYDDDGNYHATLEVPGICTDDVELKVRGRKVKVRCTSGDRKYAKDLKVRFTPRREDVHYDVKNGILRVEIPDPRGKSEEGKTGEEVRPE
ncbi:MAG: Hsp20/alpha crystallin family protein [Promethearchaeota archaeon]